MRLSVIFELGTIGWVHRDLSVGNVYLYKTEDIMTAKLGDFEYAKKIDEDTVSHDFRTVCPFTVDPTRIIIPYRVHGGSGRSRSKYVVTDLQ